MACDNKVNHSNYFESEAIVEIEKEVIVEKPKTFKRIKKVK